MQLTQSKLKQLRGIGHKLNPIVTIAEKGLGDTQTQEINRALTDHELIKVKFAINDRDHKSNVIDEMIKATNAHLIQQVGKVALIFRENPKPNKKLSNLIRPLD